MTWVTVHGNEAAASAAYRLNEACCIYPITPSSPMAELADELNWLLTLLAHVLQRGDRRLVPDDVAGLVCHVRDHAFSGTG
jgi:pyruvate/2-oxoacid:ferredoxin oxidoreductase alpha subunit